MPRDSAPGVLSPNDFGRIVPKVNRPMGCSALIVRLEASPVLAGAASRRERHQLLWGGTLFRGHGGDFPSTGFHPPHGWGRQPSTVH